MTADDGHFHPGSAMRLTHQGDAKTCVAYTLLDGRKGQVPVETIDHVSLLSDGRGVMYTKAGRVIVVRDGLKVLEQWRRLRVEAE